MQPEGSPKFDSAQPKSDQAESHLDKESLTNKQKAAIVRSIQLGRKIQQTIPEIDEDYNNNLSASQIVSKYGILARFNISQRHTAIKGVQRALHGYDSSAITGLKPYPPLIADAAIRKNLGREHQKKSGEEARDKKLGMFSLSDEDLKESKKAGGTKLFEQGEGVHAQSQKERMLTGAMGAAARGFKLISDAEKLFIREMASKPGNSAQTIANAANEKFHKGKKVRHRQTISNFLYKRKRRRI